MKKVKKILTYVGTFLGVFAVSAVTAYFAMPTNVRGVGNTGNGANSTNNSSIDDGGNDDAPTDAEQFIARLASKATQGLTGTIDAYFTIPQEGKSNNITIEVNNATLKFAMPSLSNIRIDLSAAVSYNDRARQLDLTYADNEAYFSLSFPDSLVSETNPRGGDWDLKYCLDLSTESSVDENGNQQNTQFKDLVTIGQYIVEMVGDAFDFTSISSSLSSMTSSLDTSALLTAFGAMESVKQEDNSINYYMNLPFGDFNMPIMMSSDSDYNLTEILLPGYNGTPSSSTVDLANGMSFYADIKCAYGSVEIGTPAYNVSSYHPLVNSLDLVGSLYNLVAKPKFGISLVDASLTHVVDSDKNVNETTDLSLNANVDLLDMSKPLIGASMSMKAGETTQTLAVDYTDSTTFVNLSNVVKAKMSQATFDALLGSIKNTSFGGSDASKTEDSINKILDLMTSVKLTNTIKAIMNGVTSVKGCTLLNGMNDGKYEAAFDFITSITSTDNKIVIVLNLSPLSIDGTITLTLDATSGAGNLLSLELSDIALASFTFSGTLQVNDYVAPEAVVSDNYQALTHLPTVYDQFASIMSDKKGAFSLSGNVMDSGSTTKGFTFSGSAELDVDPKSTTYKSGTGDILITNLSGLDDSNNQISQDYKVAIDVAGVDQMFFTYNSGAFVKDSNGKDTTTPKYLKGRFTINTLNDIISLVESLISSKDARFSKYSSTFTSLLSGTIVGDLVDNKLSSLVENNILVSTSFESNSSTFVIAKGLMGTTSDVTIKINYDVSGKLASLAVNLTTGGKDIALNVGVKATTGKLQRIADHTLSNYMDFSQISVLLEYLKNDALLGTSETNSVSTYHLVADASATLGVLNIDAVKIDMYLYLDGATFKMYGSVTLPMITSVDCNGKGNHLGGTRTTTFAYETNEDDPDGTVYIKRYDDNFWWIHDPINSASDYTMYRKVDGKEFMNNIKGWLLGFMLGIEDSIFDSSSSSSTSSPIYVENGLNSFTYTAGTTPTWNLSLDLGALTNVSALKDMDLTLKGNSTSKVLNKLDFTLGIVELVKITLTMNVSLDNVSDSGVYTECWSAKDSTFTSFKGNSGFGSFSTDYDASKGK
jgi:hypothetical protein